MKVKNFFSKNKEYFLSSLIILIIMLSLYAIFSAFPFGTNTLSHYDMAAQIIPQSELIFDFFNGKSPLFYSTKFGTGANTFGYLIYFILSPFNLLMLLGGEGNLQYSLNIVFILKLICICCVAIWFLKKYFKNLGALKTLILALSYTFCGYMLMVYTYMSFLDYLIYAPIFVNCFNLLKDENKKFPFVFVVFFMIVSCFSLGCFTLLYLFVIFGAYIFIVVEKKSRKDLIIKVLSCVAISIGLSTPILLPSFVQYLSSGRNAEISFISAYPFHGTPSKILTSTAEIICCVFAIIFIFKCDKKDKLNRFLIFIEMLTLLTIISDEVLMAFNGGSILGYYARFGFVGAFTTLILASKFLDSLTFENEKPKFVIPIYLTLITFLVLYAVFIFIFYKPISDSFANQYSNFSYLFVFILISIVILFPFIISISLKKNIKIHFLICSFILTLSLIAGNSVLFFSSGFLPTDSYRAISQLTSEIQETNRVKVFSTGYESLSQTLLNYSSTSTFSSLANKDALNSLQNLGYLTSINSTQSFGGTLLSDIIVNNEYSLYPFKVDRWYLELVGEQDGFYLYKNTLCNGYAKILYDKQELSNNILDNQQKIYEMLGGKNILLEQVYPELTFTNCHVDENNLIVAENKLEERFISFDISLDEGEILYLYVHSDDNYNISINVDSCSISYNCLIELNTNKNEDSLINIYDNIPIDYLSFYTLDSYKLQDITTFESNTYQDYNILNSNLYLNSNATIMLPFTTLDGYSVYVNGEKQEFTNDFLSFMTLNLKEGENNIKIVFNNPLFDYVLIGFVLGAILITAGLLVYYFKEKFNKKFIMSMFIIVLSLFITYFIAYPANLTLIKIFTSL